MINLVIGVIIGANLGVLVIGLCQAAGKPAQRKMEEK